MKPRVKDHLSFLKIIVFDTKQDSLNSFFRFKKLKPSYIIDNFKLKLFILYLLKSFFRLSMKSLNCIGAYTDYTVFFRKSSKFIGRHFMDKHT